MTRTKRKGGTAGAKAPRTRAASESRRRGLWGKVLLALAALAVVVGVLSWSAPPGGGPAVPEALRLRVVAEHPHDTAAFTQGLLFHDGSLYESTGRYGLSTVRRVAIETGVVQDSTELPDEIFAEGLARVGDELIQLSWREGRAIVWDLRTLEVVREHAYNGEGWGLCHDGRRLVMSTGSDRLVFRDPVSFERIGEVRVRRAGRPLRRLNELECVDGLVYANVWMDDHIARIDPETGDVTAWIDASGLLPPSRRLGDEDVLNGIAWNPDSGRFYLTGKLWPVLFEVELVPTG